MIIILITRFFPKLQALKTKGSQTFKTDPEMSTKWNAVIKWNVSIRKKPR